MIRYDMFMLHGWEGGGGDTMIIIISIFFFNFSLFPGCVSYVENG